MKAEVYEYDENGNYKEIEDLFTCDDGEDYQNKFNKRYNRIDFFGMEGHGMSIYRDSLPSIYRFRVEIEDSWTCSTFMIKNTIALLKFVRTEALPYLSLIFFQHDSVMKVFNYFFHEKWEQLPKAFQ